VKVRVFHENHSARPAHQMTEEVRTPHRVLPKKTSWEEALARFEKIAPSVPAESDRLGGTTNSKAHS